MKLRRLLPGVHDRDDLHDARRLINPIVNTVRKARDNDRTGAGIPLRSTHWKGRKPFCCLPNARHDTYRCSHIVVRNIRLNFP